MQRPSDEKQPEEEREVEGDEKHGTCDPKRHAGQIHGVDRMVGRAVGELHANIGLPPLTRAGPAYDGGRRETIGKRQHGQCLAVSFRRASYKRPKARSTGGFRERRHDCHHHTVIWQRRSQDVVRGIVVELDQADATGRTALGNDGLVGLRLPLSHTDPDTLPG